MELERFQQIEEIFQRAVELPPAERQPYLLRTTGNDPSLRREVESLIAAHVESESFLEEPVIEGGLSRLLPESEADSRLGRVGPYKLLRKLGEGGMSQVFLAVRDDDEYQKLVALKVIRHGMDRDDLRRRFRTERQILASLDHPNIAKLLDGGTTEDDLPYFVMEYIEGVPIDEYCDRGRLTIPERLELFRTVCAAVQYAHQNLVVHRDLKASNILVSADGAPKLLDFGIAKLLKPEQFPAPVELTATRMRPMTPFYASPEQIQGRLITTSSDVYSLGVLLFRLLTGRFPYRLRGSTPREVEKAVLEEQPRVPSMVMGRSAAGDDETGNWSPEAASAARRASPAQLERRLRGDLDNMVLMALRKEPQRRYASVEQQSEDIRRYLTGRPVLAHKDSLRYRTSKFFRRNRLAVAVASGFILLLVGFAVSMGVLASRIAHERDQAQRERDRAEQVVAFLQEIFQVSDPGRAKGETVTAREILDRGARRIDEELRDQPAVQATLMDAIGNVYRNLGLYDWAVPLLERSVEIRRRELGADHPDYARSLNQLGVTLSLKGDYPGATPVLREALELRERLHGNESPEVAESLNNLGRLHHNKGDEEIAEELYRRALRVQGAVSGEDSPELAELQSNLAILLSMRGQFDEAEALMRRALQSRRSWLPEDDPQLASSLNDLGVLLGVTGRYEEVEPFFREALEIRRRVLGLDHPDTAESLNNLGRLLKELGDFSGAEPLYRESIEVWRRLGGDEHPRLAVQINNLAVLLQEQGRYAEAEPLLRESLAIKRKALGDGHRDTGVTLKALGNLLRDTGDPKAAEPLFRRTVEIFESTLPADHWQLADARSVLGACLADLGRNAEAEPLLVEGLAALEASLGADHLRSERARKRLEDFRQARDGPVRKAG